MNPSHQNPLTTESRQQHENRLNTIYSRRSMRYKFSHSLWTLCVDRYWRRMTALSITKPAALLLDIGSGTGLTSAKILELGKTRVAIGIDRNFDMIARSKNLPISQGLFAPVNGDALQLPFRDNAFDVVVTMLGMGGIFDAEQAYREIIRVAKNGAQLLSLEMCEPKNPILRFLHKHLTERLVDKYWGFRDIDIEGVIQRLGITDFTLRRRNDMLLGSVYQLNATVAK